MFLTALAARARARLPREKPSKNPLQSLASQCVDGGLEAAGDDLFELLGIETEVVSKEEIKVGWGGVDIDGFRGAAKLANLLDLLEKAVLVLIRAGASFGLLGDQVVDPIQGVLVLPMSVDFLLNHLVERLVDDHGNSVLVETANFFGVVVGLHGVARNDQVRTVVGGNVCGQGVADLSVEVGNFFLIFVFNVVRGEDWGQGRGGGHSL